MYCLYTRSLGRLEPCCKSEMNFTKVHFRQWPYQNVEFPPGILVYWAHLHLTNKCLKRAICAHQHRTNKLKTWAHLHRSNRLKTYRLKTWTNLTNKLKTWAHLHQTHKLKTWAHLQSETTSRKEKARSRSSFGSFLLNCYYHPLVLVTK